MKEWNPNLDRPDCIAEYHSATQYIFKCHDAGILTTCPEVANSEIFRRGRADAASYQRSRIRLVIEFLHDRSSVFPVRTRFKSSSLDFISIIITRR
jgi:hypothetical protein